MPRSTRSLKHAPALRVPFLPALDGALPCVVDPAGRYVFARPLDADEVIRVAEAICAARVSREAQATRPEVLSQYLVMRLAPLSYEVFAMVYLDTRLGILGFEELFRGSVSTTAVYPNQVVRQALLWNASAVALVHNHPSGIPEPSREDQLLTERLAAALRTVDVRVIDHLIVAGARTVSFASLGLI